MIIIHIINNNIIKYSYIKIFRQFLHNVFDTNGAVYITRKQFISTYTHSKKNSFYL